MAGLDPKTMGFEPFMITFLLGLVVVLVALVIALLLIGVALVGLPAIFGTLGLTGVGIAAGSIAAKMIMGADGDVAEDGEVAVLQTIGSAAYSLGVKTGLKTALRSVSAATDDWLSKWKKTSSDKPKETTNIQVTNPKKDKNPSDKPKKK